MLGIRNVDRQSEARRPERLHFLYHRGNRIRGKGRNHNVGAGLCKRRGTGPSDATATTGNNGGPAFQGKAREIDLVHGILLIMQEQFPALNLCQTNPLGPCIKELKLFG